MMTLSLVLQRLGMTGYQDLFVQNGFGTWEELMNITYENLEVGMSSALKSI